MAARRSARQPDPTNDGLFGAKHGRRRRTATAPRDRKLAAIAPRFPANPWL